MAPFVVPRRLREVADADESTQAWLATVPATLASVAAEWALSVGAPFQPGGVTAWVAPATTAAGEPCVVKLGRIHVEGEHEADGLRAWAGDGAVKLLDTLDRAPTAVLLLERCRPGTALRERSEPEQDEVIAGLLRRLWIAPPRGAEGSGGVALGGESGSPLRHLSTMCDDWAARFERDADERSALLDAGLVRAGLALLRELPAPATTDVLLCTDLHAENVLAAEREPWLVIDPKPHVGDPAYDPVQHLLNCPTRLQDDPEGLVRRMAGLTGVDAERLRWWVFARCVQESYRWDGLAEVARRIAPH